MNVTFAEPLAVLLVIAPALALVAGLILSGRSLGRPAPLALRALAVGLLAAGLGGPQAGVPGPGTVILRDVSESAGAAPEQLATLPALARLDFAGLVGPQGTDRRALDPAGTDLKGALQAAASGGPERILLATDGGMTTGDPLTTLPDVPIDVLVLPSRENTRIVSVTLPPSLTQAPAQASLVLQSSRATSARIIPTLNGQPLPGRDIVVPSGKSVFTVPFTPPGPGEVRLDVHISVDYPQPTLDDDATAFAQVSGTAPVLVIGDPAAARLLRAQGFAVREGTPDAVREPFNPPSVIIRAPATAFSLGQLRLVANYVSDGGGLLLTGGPGAFGLGGWARTPVEDTLPVSSDLRTRVDMPLVAMVLILDHSLSMAGGTGSDTTQKLSLAVEGVSNVIELANEHDLLGLLTFSDDPAWIFGLTQATDAHKLQMAATLDAVQASGGTVLEPAYRQAVTALQNAKAAIKHIIILSDGQLADGSPSGASAGPDFGALARSALQDGITTSTIAVGQDADGPRMTAIARGGGGRFYWAMDASTLPRIFTAEALTATRGIVRSEGVKPKVLTHPLTVGLAASAPTLSRYVATTLKPEGEVLLTGLDREPVLAVNRHGLGRTAALTADLNEASPFTGWVKLPGLLGTVTRWLQIQPQPYTLAVSPDGQTVTVDAVSGNEYKNGLNLQATVGGQTLNLEQVGPGRYEAPLPAEANGPVILLNRGAVLGRALVSPANRELGAADGVAILRRLAAASGGRVLSSLAGYQPATRDARLPLTPYLLLAAIIVFLSELAWRRFGERSA